MATAFINNRPAERDVPFYQPVGNECQLFEQAYRKRLPLLLKGPTGCGKTRFVSHMAAKLGRPLFTVSCHDDLTAAVELLHHVLHFVFHPVIRKRNRGRVLRRMIRPARDVTL